MDVLDRRALNRATLARQLLLARHQVPALDAVHALAGLNAQTSKDPYIGLWARLTDFTTDDLADLLHSKQVVRSCLMRCTQHLVTAADFQIFRPVLDPVLARVQRTIWGRRTEGVDPDELAALGSSALRGVTLPRSQLGKQLQERWPNHQASDLGWSFQYLAPVVHPPPDGLWGRTSYWLLTIAWPPRPKACGCWVSCTSNCRSARFRWSDSRTSCGGRASARPGSSGPAAPARRSAT